MQVDAQRFHDEAVHRVEAFRGEGVVPGRNTDVDVHVTDTTFEIHDTAGELLASIPKTTTKDISRYKAYGWTDNID